MTPRPTPPPMPRPVRPAASAAPAIAPEPDAFLPPIHKLGFLLLLVFFFLAFSRVMDSTLPQLHLPFIVSVATLLCALVCGGIKRILSTTEGLLLIAFSVWLTVGIPFSSWRGGSFILLKDIWSKSFLCFMLVVSLIVTVRQVKKMMIVIGLATFTLSIFALVKQTRHMGRLTFDVGMFANSNDLAQAILLGIPLLAAVNVPRSNPFFKLFTIAAAAPMLLAIVQTGSRSAVLAIIVMLTFSFLRVGGLGKLLVALILVCGAVGALTMMPSVIGERIVLSKEDLEEGAGKEAESAAASAESRKDLLIQSLKLTLRHPVFGVGPGVFQHASTVDSNSQGKRGMWKETHNMYTQISAETGVIGFVLYFSAVGVLFRKLKVLRARCNVDRRLRPLGNLLFIYILSFLSLLLTGAFNSVAYQMLVPAFIGIGSALYIAGMAEADRLTGATPVPAAAAPAPRPVPPPRPRGPLPHMPRPLAPRFPREARKLG